MIKFRNEFKKEKTERLELLIYLFYREEFEENIFHLLEETYVKIANKDQYD